MKSITIRASVLGLVLSLAACSGSGPDDTVVRMHAHLCESGDPAVMSEYLSESSKQAMGPMLAMLSESAKAEQFKRQLKADCEKHGGKVEILEVKVDGDRADVRYRLGEKEDSEHLVRENDQWKIAMKK